MRPTLTPRTWTPIGQEVVWQVSRRGDEGGRVSTGRTTERDEMTPQPPPAGPGYDAEKFHAERFKANAPERYAELRARGPIHRARGADGLEAWIVVGHELAREALTHPLLIKNPEIAGDALRAAGQHVLFASTGLGGNMLMSDPPAHGRLREAVSAVFTARRVQGLVPSIRRTARHLLDALPAEGVADLVETYTGPLPLAVICDLLGVPEDRRADLRGWSRAAVSATGDRQREGLRMLNTYLARLLADKRRAPGSDLLSALVTMREQDRLSDVELLGTAVLLMTAGHETTVHLLGNAMVALLDHPDQQRLLRERPELLPGAVEELLRYDPSVELTPARFAAEEFVLGGEVIPRAGMVMIALGSANRDAPLAGGGDPDTLDVTRRPARHLAFGHGIHYCLGAPLARVEAAVGLGVLLETLGDIAWADPGDPVSWLPSGIARGPVAVPVRYRKATHHATPTA
jgi:cytochrome P450